MTHHSQLNQVLAECARASSRGAAPPFRSASNANKILVCAMQLGCGQYLMHTLSPLFASIFIGNGAGGGDLTSIAAFPPSPGAVRIGITDSTKIVGALDDVRPCSQDVYCTLLRPHAQAGFELHCEQHHARAHVASLCLSACVQCHVHKR
jgi:hypothetical protein